MKKQMKGMILLVLVLALCAALTGIYTFVYVLQDDTTAPKILLASEKLMVSVEADEAQLLEGVQAVDEEDGDVTDSLLVEGISGISQDHTATVTYVAFDKSGNVAKTTRTLQYVDYKAPKFYQKRSLTVSANTNPDILSYMGAVDVIDGDISDRIKGSLVSETGSLIHPGIHQVQFRVTNSMGDTQYLTLPVEVYTGGTYNATLELKDYLVYVRQGGTFRAEDYPKTLRIGSNAYAMAGLDAQVQISSDVNTAVPGVYCVTYTVNYKDIYTGYARLNVVVEEAQ